MELGYSKEKQLGKKKGKKKQSYSTVLAEYKRTGKFPEGMTKENGDRLHKYIDRECEVLWKEACVKTHGRALSGNAIDRRYYPGLDLSQSWQVHHLIGRTHWGTKWDVENGIYITSGVHFHLTNTDPNRFLAWLKESYPKRYEWREENLILAYKYNRKPTVEELLGIKEGLKNWLNHNSSRANSGNQN